MHLKDKRLDQQTDNGRHVDTHIGLGNTNYVGLVAAMKQAGWSGVMALETDSAEFAKDPTEFVTRGKKFFEAHFGK
jgi:sugar phosphate isomerase/epimerase